MWNLNFNLNISWVLSSFVYAEICRAMRTYAKVTFGKQFRIFRSVWIFVRQTCKEKTLSWINCSFVKKLYLKKYNHLSIKYFKRLNKCICFEYLSIKRKFLLGILGCFNQKLPLFYHRINAPRVVETSGADMNLAEL